VKGSALLIVPMLLRGNGKRSHIQENVIPRAAKQRRGIHTPHGFCVLRLCAGWRAWRLRAEWLWIWRFSRIERR